MPKLLVIDPLDLELSAGEPMGPWRSRSCYEKGLAGLGDRAEIVYANGRDPALCEMALGSQAVILGGSEASAWEDTAFNDHLLDLIAICKNGQIPFLGICYGAQLLGRALGGQVGPHPRGIELGEVEIGLNAVGRRHFLFDGRERFRAIATHNDAVFTLPPGCATLASTDHTPIQAFACGGLLLGVQFHPEMDASDLRRLWIAFERDGVVDAISGRRRAALESCRGERLPWLLERFARWAFRWSEQEAESTGRGLDDAGRR